MHGSDSDKLRVGPLIAGVRHAENVSGFRVYPFVAPVPNEGSHFRGRTKTREVLSNYPQPLVYLGLIF